MRPRRITRTSVVAAGICTVVATAVTGVAAVASYREAVALRDNGLVTTADVLSRDADYVEVVFTSRSGRPVRTAFTDFRGDPYPQPGSTMQVRYDPDDPYRHIQDARQRPDLVGAWLLGALGLAVAAFGLTLTYLTWPLVGTYWP